jgi:hypothetical protein
MDSDAARLIRQAGIALYGERWLTPLSAALGINPRTVRRWEAEQQEVPAAIRERMQALARARIGELEQLLQPSASNHHRLERQTTMADTSVFSDGSNSMKFSADGQRWTAHRKAGVVRLVTLGILSEAEACARYGIGAEELREWLRRSTVLRLRTTNALAMRQPRIVVQE